MISAVKSTLTSILNIRTATGINRLIYYSKRIPWIGKSLNDSLYADHSLKKNLAVIVTILKVVWSILNKFLYIGLLMYLPVVLLQKDLPAGEQFEIFLNIFVLLSLVVAAISNTAILEPKRDKYIAVKLMRLSPASYMHATMSLKYLTFCIYFLPAVLVFFFLLGAPVWQALLFTVLMTAWRLAGEAFALWVFEKRGILLWRNYALIWTVILAGYLAAYASLYLGKPLFHSSWLFNLPLSLILIILGGAAVYYMARYPDYRKAVDAVTKIDEPLLDMGRMMSKAREAEVNIKEADSGFEYSAIDKYQDKTGYAYLNAIFFARHRRFLIQPILRRLYIIAALCTAGFASMLIFPEISEVLAGKLVNSLPLLVFIMYFTSIGERVCKAMFYNCDLSLLRYSFYREKETILKNFRIRLLKISGLNLIPAAFIAASVSALILSSGVSWELLDALSFIGSVLLLSLFFSVHHLFMYYIFQPYAAEFNMKNPFFVIVNTVVYAICFISFQFDTAPAYFAVVVLGATAVYISVALILVYRLSPRTFRIK